MRLGQYECHLTPGSHASDAYGVSVVHERHRHRLEFNNDFRGAFEEGAWCLAVSHPTVDWSKLPSCQDTRFFWKSVPSRAQVAPECTPSALPSVCRGVYRPASGRRTDCAPNRRNWRRSPDVELIVRLRCNAKVCKRSSGLWVP